MHNNNKIKKNRVLAEFQLTDSLHHHQPSAATAVRAIHRFHLDQAHFSKKFTSSLLPLAIASFSKSTACTFSSLSPTL
jgi:hypothetical protein